MNVSNSGFNKSLKDSPHYCLFGWDKRVLNCINDPTIGATSIYNMEQYYRNLQHYIRMQEQILLDKLRSINLMYQSNKHARGKLLAIG